MSMSVPAQSPKSKRSTVAKEGVELVKTILFALLIALALRTLVFQAVTIPSGSMEPNLFAGDYLIISKYSYGYSRYSIPFSPPLFKGRLFAKSPRRGDIIVFKLPRDPKIDYVKRLIGLPGDRVQVRSGVVFINGEPLKRQARGVGVTAIGHVDVPVDQVEETNPEGRSYLTNSIPQNQLAETTGVYVVPPHCYFMMGDNRDNSLDSRFDPGLPVKASGPKACGWDASWDAYLPTDETGVGFVPEENLVGRAEIVLLSWRDGVSLFKPWTWVMNARPNRVFHRVS
jgi:signal peptidase I